MEEGFKLVLSSVCSTWAKNNRSYFERFPFARICHCCSGRQISYQYLFFPGLESVIHLFLIQPYKGGVQGPTASIWGYQVPLPRAPQMGGHGGTSCLKTAHPIPACPRLHSGSVEPGLAGPGQDCWAWKPHPSNIMTNPGSLGSSQSETWKTNFSSWKGRDGITVLFLSLPAFALTFPALRDERWQKLHLVIRGRFSAEINKLNNADEVSEI